MGLSDVVIIKYGGSTIHEAGCNSNFTLKTAQKWLSDDILVEVGNVIDTSDATLMSGGQMLSAVTAYASGVKYTGTIESYSGLVNGSQYDRPYYSGEYNITPMATAQRLSTAGKILSEDVVVNAVEVDLYFNIMAGASYGSVVFSSAYLPSHFAESCVTLTGFRADNVSSVYSDTFRNCFNLEIVSIPNCNYIDCNAFAYCSALSSVDVPANRIGSNAFLSCTALKSVNYPHCTMISSWAFCGCTALEAVSFPECVSIQGGAFSEAGLKEASFPSCTAVESSAFTSCTSLSLISFPNCLRVNGDAFKRCSALTSVHLPKCVEIDQGTFFMCSLLSTLSLPAAGRISNYAFQGCYRLLSLYLMASYVCRIDVGTFASTPIAGVTTYTGGVYGSVYVPASLLASYKANGSWAAFSDRLVGI